MDDAALVGGFECRCDLRGPCDGLLEGKPAARQAPVERLAFDQLHDEKGLVSLLFEAV